MASQAARFADAARRAPEWLVAQQKEDGSFTPTTLASSPSSSRRWPRSSIAHRAWMPKTEPKAGLARNRVLPFVLLLVSLFCGEERA